MRSKASCLVVLATALYALPPLIAPCFDPEVAFTELARSHLLRSGMIGPHDVLTFDPGHLERPRCGAPPVWSVRAQQILAPTR
jgi:hypothetical protein